MFHVIKTVRSPKDRALGLSVIPHLGEYEAMLFAFPEGSEAPFWNKGVPYPIDIGFYDINGLPIYKASMQAEQLRSILPTRKYHWVLETNVGMLPKEYCLFDLI